MWYARAMVEARTRVIYGDTDQMGIVYYANYLRYFELGRSEFLRAKGGSYREMEKEGLKLPVVEAVSRYKAPAYYEDMLVVRTWVAEVRRVSLRFEYAIVREGEDRILCEGSTVHACLGPDGRPMALPEALRALVE